MIGVFVSDSFLFVADLLVREVVAAVVAVTAVSISIDRTEQIGGNYSCDVVI